MHTEKALPIKHVSCFIGKGKCERSVEKFVSRSLLFVENRLQLCAF